MKKKTVLIIIAVIAVIALLITSLVVMIKNKTLLLNRYFIDKNGELGVDVSHYQAQINMGALEEQDVSFV